MVNDYVSAWLGAIGTLEAMKRRAVKGGSYKVTIPLSRVTLWLMSMGIFDKDYARATAGSTAEHTYVEPDQLTAVTPTGVYTGVTEQVAMSETPGHYRFPLAPRFRPAAMALRPHQPHRTIMIKTRERLLLLNIGNPSKLVSSASEGGDIETLIPDIGVAPDGISVDPINHHIFRTYLRTSHEGEDFFVNDGSIHRADFDGSKQVVVIPEGATFTPEQVQCDTLNGLIYWCDREGMRVCGRERTAAA